MASIPVNQYVKTNESHWAWQCVEAGERVFAGILILALAPGFCVIWLTLFALSGRSPLISHRRVGWNRSELWVLKFRTMWDRRAKFDFRHSLSVEYIDDQAGPGLKGPGDFRIGSPFARFCRQHSIDELPQLYHVLRGQMSLVGPRPVTPAEVEQIYGSKAAEILSAKPGISGLWQVSGRNRLTLEQRCSIDLESVRTRSLKLYFQVLLRTIPEVFMGANAW